MSNTEIEAPKVFISYAWGNDDHQARVLSFAEDLVRDGIDVVIDRWALKEGHDTYAFMEECVTNSSITNVLILIDEQYKNKADARSGGVGTETQIISPQIYKKVKQDKFIPIIFQRGINGDIEKPIFLETRLHFDLSDIEQYDKEYQRLVRQLYGKETKQKPSLGKKPEWVDKPSSINMKTRTKYNSLTINTSDKIKTEQFIGYISQVKDQFLNFKSEENPILKSNDDYIDLYVQFKDIRDEFLNILKYSTYIVNGDRIVADIFEELFNEISGNVTIKSIKYTLIHELFIYLIAIYFKAKNYNFLGYTLGKTYFKTDRYENGANNFNIFYYYNESLDRAIKDRDGKNYHCGTAQYWVDNINIEVCSKNEFVFADILCYNYSVFGSEYKNRNWFPITYVYGGANNRNLINFATRLKSNEHLINASTIFGYENVEKFIETFVELEVKYHNGEYKGMKYNSDFEGAPLIYSYIKAIDIGVLK